MLFQVKDKNLIKISEKSFDYERDLQRLVENNLETIFGLEFVSSEFQLQGLRMDSLAFDKEANSFVIIEYKRDKSFSVIDQGFSYLSLMLNNKAEFIQEYYEKKNKNLRREEIDWSQAKVIFLASNFTNYQQNAINFKDLPIELWEVAYFENGVLLFNKVKTNSSSESIRTVSRDKIVEKVSKEIKQYSENEFLHDEKSKELYLELKEKVLSLNNDFVPRPTKYYIGFHLADNWRNIFTITFRKGWFVVDFARSQPSDFNDPEKRVLYRRDSMENYNQHISYIDVKSKKDLEYCVYLLRQAYERFIKNQ